MLAVTVLLSLAVPRVVLADGRRRRPAEPSGTPGSSADVVADPAGGPGFGGVDAAGRPARERQRRDAGRNAAASHARRAAAPVRPRHEPAVTAVQRPPSPRAGSATTPDPGHPRSCTSATSTHDRPGRALGRGRRAARVPRSRPRRRADDPRLVEVGVSVDAADGSASPSGSGSRLRARPRRRRGGGHRPLRAGRRRVAGVGRPRRTSSTWCRRRRGRRRRPRGPARVRRVPARHAARDPGHAVADDVRPVPCRARGPGRHRTQAVERAVSPLVARPAR